MRCLRFLQDFYILAHLASGCLSYVTALSHCLVTDLAKIGAVSHHLPPTLPPSLPGKQSPSPQRLSRMAITNFSLTLAGFHNIGLFEVLPLVDKNFFLERSEVKGRLSLMQDLSRFAIDIPREAADERGN